LIRFKNMNIYYEIWVDFIQSFRKHHPREDWKMRLFTLVTFLNALNFWSVISILRIFKVSTFLDKISTVQGSKIYLASIFFIQYAFIFVLINYFLIFYKKRYEKLLKKYSPRNGRLALSYAFLSLGVAFGIACTFFFYVY
jgi:hypothetical protein